MFLTQTDREYLSGEYHESDAAIAQIEQAISKTRFENSKGEKLTQKQAITLLGRKKFLAGMDRSAFHWSATQSVQLDDSAEDIVYFDSSRFFRS
jgi:hypothetical protein